ncbi:restriction endonuclease subunit S [Pediococcus parvulus]|uniref:restriction endonuclease subunit S n=1 Tax=Pediococcus parvulus TaxID=54062 RepID=UPI00071040EE|nr:restriction endonuclease subunit S [Pediococcus parvulus]MCT3028039.1 restriction endonuclease subunit S [Pediococcus parvulus]GEL90522.1 hypothetical protein PPA04_17530 [Pediococcus parvulus]GHC15263.1 hypothetical protein GCM10008912_18560 [Pediococcus parvulus]
MKDKQTKYPQLRFKGFTDPWEQRKLTDISEKVTEKNSDNEFSETLTNSAEYGIISQRDFFDKDISNEKNLNTYYVVRDGDFVYNPRISNFAPVGPIKRNTLGRTGVMSPLYYIFRAHNVDGMYLEKYFSSTKWHRFMELNGDTGARADRFAIKDKDFVQMPIPLPNLEEQSKIARFLENVDNLIAANQRKLDLLKELKQGYLQKLFPQNGSKFPQLRFAGFADAWEQRKLGEIVEINSGRDYKKLGRGKIPVFGTGGYMLSVNGKLSDRDSVGIGRKGSIDKPQFLSAPFWTVDTLFFMTPKNKNDAKFIFDLSQLIQWKKYDESTGVPSLSKSTISNIPITVTKEDEQNKVSTLFELVDKIIAANQRKVEKLKELKKGYMQKMFC